MKMLSLFYLGLLSVTGSFAQSRHNLALWKVDLEVRKMVSEGQQRSAIAFEAEYEFSIRQATLGAATRESVYRAILLSNFHGWMTHGMGIPDNALMTQLQQSFERFGGSSYESEKVKVLCCRRYWLTPEAAKISQELYGQEPSDLSMHLAALVAKMGYGNVKIEIDRVLTEIPNLQKTYPRFTGLWMMSTFLHVGRSSVHPSVKKEELLKARSEMLIYMKRMEGPKGDAESYLRQIETMLSKLENKE